METATGKDDQHSPRAIYVESQIVVLGDGQQEEREAHDRGEAGAPVDEPRGGQPVVI